MQTRESKSVAKTVERKIPRARVTQAQVREAISPDSR